MRSELVACEVFNGMRAVCQTGPQRVSGRKEQGQAGSHSRPPVGPRRRTAARSDERARVSGRVPGRFRPHHDGAPTQRSAARLREASEMGPVAGPAPAAISVRGGRTLVDSTLLGEGGRYLRNSPTLPHGKGWCVSST
jgi:hypothetical protein